MASNRVRISILEDHQGIIDGYLYRLSTDKRVEIAGIARYGEELVDVLKEKPSDVLLLDIEIPTSPTNPNQYSILTTLPMLQHRFPQLAVLVVSSHTQQVLVESLFEHGISGYIFKSDHNAIEHLGDIILSVARGDLYFSAGASDKLRSSKSQSSKRRLSPRQLEALSLCMAFPDSSTVELAEKLGVTSSTFRNLLSKAYERLGVRTRVAAVTELQRMGLGPSTFNLE